MDQNTKSEFIVKLLCLRKICKIPQKANQLGFLFGKIALIINKYEFCPDFCHQKFQMYSIILYSSNILSSFNFRSGLLKKSIANVISITYRDNYYVEQIKDNLLIISGGNESSKRFIILLIENDQYKTQELETLFSRSHHRTIFDDKASIYLIGGETTKSHVVFNMKSLKFTPCFEDFPITFRTFGFCVVKEDFYIFSGLNFDKSQGQNSIYTYSIANQKLRLLQIQLADKSSQSAVYLKKEQSCYI